MGAGVGRRSSEEVVVAAGAVETDWWFSTSSWACSAETSGEGASVATTAWAEVGANVVASTAGTTFSSAFSVAASGCCSSSAGAVVLVSQEGEEETGVSAAGWGVCEEVAEDSVDSSASGRSASSSAASGVLSLRVTVVKCAKGRLTNSRNVPSGVKLILLCPLIWKRSPVLMFTLSRSLTSTNLKVPKPVTLTKLSLRRPSSVNSKKERTKSSACSRGSDSRSAKSAARS